MFVFDLLILKNVGEHRCIAFSPKTQLKRYAANRRSLFRTIVAKEPTEVQVGERSTCWERDTRGAVGRLCVGSVTHWAADKARMCNGVFWERLGKIIPQVSGLRHAGKVLSLETGKFAIAFYTTHLLIFYRTMVNCSLEMMVLRLRKTFMLTFYHLYSHLCQLRSTADISVSLCSKYDPTPSRIVTVKEIYWSSIF